MKYGISLVGILLLSGFLYAASQPYQLGRISLPSMTTTQIDALTSNTTGEFVFCNNCGGAGGKGTVCVSTSIAARGFVLSTGTWCH